jgi:hypothetical protein
MVIFTNPFVLAQAAGAHPLTHGRIGWRTYTRGALASQVTVSTETTDGPKDAPLRSDTAEYWLASALPATWQFDIGSLQSVNYVGIAGHDIATQGASIKAETSPDGSAWEDLAVEHLPANNAPIMFLDDERSAKHLRLTVQGLGNAPRIASIYFGLTLDLPRPIYGGVSPLNLSRVTELRTAVSRGGQFLGRSIQSMGVAGSVALRHLLAGWYRSDFDPFVESIRLHPFFYAWRPASFPNEVVYIWTTEDVAPSNMGIRDFMQVNLAVQGIGYAA